MKRIIEASFVVLSLFLASDVAQGCVCAGLPEKPTPEQARAMLVKDYNGAFAVFSGEVVALDTFKVKFKVDKVWKGDFGDDVTMSTGAQDNGDGTYTSSSCDFNFKLGEKYLVYADGASPAKMQAHECTRTRLLKYAEQEMKDLDEVWPHKQMNQGTAEAPHPAAKSNNGMHPTPPTVPLMYVERGRG
ncbi:MAG: hypothetical protein ND895_03380 [Pyrinomonadaceae bacterium]|nr:hypothetical protein [Pyrinomonadaceae bacterium]